MTDKDRPGTRGQRLRSSSHGKGKDETLDVGMDGDARSLVNASVRYVNYLIIAVLASMPASKPVHSMLLSVYLCAMRAH